MKLKSLTKPLIFILILSVFVALFALNAFGINDLMHQAMEPIGINGIHSNVERAEAAGNSDKASKVPGINFTSNNTYYLNLSDTNYLSYAWDIDINLIQRYAADSIGNNQYKWDVGNIENNHGNSGHAIYCMDYDLGERAQLLANAGLLSLSFSGNLQTKDYRNLSSVSFCIFSSTADYTGLSSGSSSSSYYKWAVGDAAPTSGTYTRHYNPALGTGFREWANETNPGTAVTFNTPQRMSGRYVRVLLVMWDQGGTNYKFGSSTFNNMELKIHVSNVPNSTIHIDNPISGYNSDLTTSHNLDITDGVGVEAASIVYTPQGTNVPITTNFSWAGDGNPNPTYIDYSVGDLGYGTAAYGKYVVSITNSGNVTTTKTFYYIASHDNPAQDSTVVDLSSQFDANDFNGSSSYTIPLSNIDQSKLGRAFDNGLYMFHTVNTTASEWSFSPVLSSDSGSGHAVMYYDVYLGSYVESMISRGAQLEVYFTGTSGSGISHVVGVLSKGSEFTNTAAGTLYRMARWCTDYATNNESNWTDNTIDTGVVAHYGAQGQNMTYGDNATTRKDTYLTGAYVRIILGVYSGSTFQKASIANPSLSIRVADTTDPTIGYTPVASNNAYTASNQVTISEYGNANNSVVATPTNGIHSYSYTLTKFDNQTAAPVSADYTTTSGFTTSTTITLPQMGTYTITTRDWLGNATTQTITYWRPTLSVSIATDGDSSSTSGGTIALGTASDTQGSGYSTTSITNTVYNVGQVMAFWAKPNAGYYFAGITKSSATKPLHGSDFGRKITSTFDQNSTANYSGFVSTSNLEFLYAISLINKPTVDIGNNGAIELVVNFKKLDATFATDAQTLTYDNVSYPVTIKGTYAHASGGTFESYIATQVYNGTLANGTPTTAVPKDAGTYTYGAQVTGSGILLGKIERTLTINRIVVSYTAENKTVTYGESADLTYTTTFTPSTQGYAQFEDVDDVISSITRAEGNNVGSYAITINLTNNNNYDVTVTNATYTINKRPITFTAHYKEHVYGEAVLDLTYDVAGSGFAPNEDESDFGFSISRTQNNNVGTYPITIVAVNSNYDITNNGNSYKITARPISFVAESKSQIYGDTALPLTYTTEGSFAPDESETNLAFSITRKEGNNVGSYDITITASNTNYAITITNATYTITARPITITATTTSGSKIYGDSDPTFGYTVQYTGDILKTAIIAGDDLALSATRVSGENVGTYAVSVNYNTENTNYDVTHNGTSLEITKRTLTGSFAGLGADGVLSATYTGKDFALIIKYANFANGEDESVLSGTPSITVASVNSGYTYPNAGLYTATYTLNDVSAQNYTIVSANATQFEITKAPLTITYKGASVPFGTPTSEISTEVEYTGLVNGETSTALATLPQVSFATLSTSFGFINATVGESVTPSGAYAANYDITYQSGTLVVTKKEITLGYNKSFEYGVTPSVNINDITVPNGALVAGDSKNSLTLSAINMNYINVGTYTIDSDDIVITANNYDVTVSGTLTITKATLTVEVSFDKDSYTYGDSVVATIEYSGFKYEDTKEIVFGLALPTATVAKNALGFVDAGTQTITPAIADGFEAQNYTINIVSKQLIVDKKTGLTITYLGDSLVYNGLNQAPQQSSVTVTGFVTGESFDGGFAVGQNVNTKSTFGNFDFGGYSSSFVCKVENMMPFLVGNQENMLANYVVNTVGGVFEITKVAIAFTADSVTQVYGEAEVALTYQLTSGDFVNDYDRNNTKVTISRESGNTVGEYDITLSATNSNYDITLNPGIYSITPRDLNVTFSLTASSKDYDGTTDLTGLVAYTVDALESDKSKLAVSGFAASMADKNAGVNKPVTVDVSALALTGEASANYTLITPTVSGLTITVNTIELDVNISFNNLSITEGDTVEASDFTITYTGFIGGDTVDDITKAEVNLTEVARLTAENNIAGKVHNIPYIPASATNYTFKYEVGTILVMARRIPIDTSKLVFEDATYEYDGTNKVVEISWPEEDMPSVVQVEGYTYFNELGNSTPAHKNVGTYTVKVTFKVTDQYYYMEQDEYFATMVITKKAVSVTFSSAGLSKVYDGNTTISLAEQPTVDGLVAGESIFYNLGASYSDANVGVAKPITLYSTTATAGENTLLSNYDITVTNAASLTADITVKPVTVTFSSAGLTKVYDGNTAISLLTQPTVEGMVGSETITYNLGATYGDANVGVAKPITLNSTDAIAGAGTLLSNYDITVTNAGSLTADITAKAVTVTFSSVGLTKVYDGTTAISLLAQPTVEGMVAGESISYDLGATFGDKNTGNDKPITLNSTDAIAGEGTLLTNYTIKLENADNLTATISAKPISIIVKPQSSVYREPVVVSSEKGIGWDEAVEGSILEGDNLYISITRVGTSTNAGSYAVIATKSNSNYAVNFDYNTESARYIIEQAETQILFDRMTTEFEYTGTALELTQKNLFVYTNRDNITEGIVYPSIAKDELGNEVEVISVGKYTLTFKVVNSQNQSIQNFKEAEASVTIEVVRATPTFDFSAIAQNVYRYNGNEQHVVGATTSNTDAGVVIEYSSNTFTDVPVGGILTISVYVAATENFNEARATYDVTILKADYDLTGYSFENEEYDYDGTMRSVEVVGLPSSITATYTYDGVTQSQPFEFKNAGIYIISANYTLDERNYNRPTTLVNAARLKINQINITVEVNNQEGYYGEAPKFDKTGITVIAGNFVAGDDIDLDLELEPRDSYPIGLYQLVATTTSSGNYNITVAKGSYTILPRPIIVRADNKSSQYGDEEVALTWSIDESSPYSIIAGDTFNTVLVRAEGKVPGKYAISGTIANPNYAVTLLQPDDTYSYGTYTITPRKITVVLYNQEGTKVSDISKKGYKISGGILRGDDLDIKVVPAEEIGNTPGVYPLTVSYIDNPNYEVTIKAATFTLRLASKITIKNVISSKLYDGVPYVFDASVSSGAEPIFTINGIYVENSFTEVGIYEITVIAPIIGDYAEPDQYTFTFEIRPVELIAEDAGIKFIISMEGGFGADESLQVERTQDLVLSGENYTQQIDSAYSFYIVKKDGRVPLEEYANGQNVSVKVGLTHEQQQLGVSTWFMDSEDNVLHAVDAPTEEGFVEVNLEGGSMHVLFVAERTEAMPILIISCTMGLAFVILFLFYLFRRKAV